MKQGDRIIVAEGEYSGKKGVLNNFSTNKDIVYATLDGIGGITPIPISFIGNYDEDSERCWYVINLKGGMPKKSHKSREEAETEAKRLASTNAGSRFYILEAIGYVESRQTVVVEEKKFGSI